jgi:hypothetical protein
MVRLNRLLRSLDIPVDLLAVSAEKFNYWCDTPGNVISRRPPRVKSSMNMKQRDQARLLLRKAAQDEALLHEALTSDQEYQNG